MVLIFILIHTNLDVDLHQLPATLVQTHTSTTSTYTSYQRHSSRHTHPRRRPTYTSYQRHSSRHTHPRRRPTPATSDTRPDTHIHDVDLHQLPATLVQTHTSTTSTYTSYQRRSPSHTHRRFDQHQKPSQSSNTLKSSSYFTYISTITN